MELSRPTPSNNGLMVTELESTVRRIAHSIHRTLPRGAQQLDDLISEGWTGALDAASRYCPDSGITLQQWCSKRIQGAIKDYLRREDPVGRSQRDRLKRLGTTAPTTVSLDDEPVQVKDRNGLTNFTTVEAVHLLKTLLPKARLGCQPSYCIRRHFLDGKPISWLAEKLGVTQGRISQIIQAALQKLAAYYARPILRRARERTGPVRLLCCQNPECSHPLFAYQQPRKKPNFTPEFCSKRCGRSARCPEGQRKLPGRAALYRLYWREGLTCCEIARSHRCAPKSVWLALRRHRIPCRPRGAQKKGGAEAPPSSSNYAAA